MRKVKTAAVQMRCEKQVQDNIAHAEELVRKAAAEGAQIILLPELFERPYFCQERRYEYYQYAKPVMENEAVCRFRQVARELSVVLPVSFYERDRNLLFNSVAVLDADGSILGITGKPIFRTTTIIRRNFILLREIRAFACLKPAMEPSASGSAGINGSRRRPGLWR